MRSFPWRGHFATRTAPARWNGTGCASSRSASSRGEGRHLLPGNLQFAGAVIQRLLLESTRGGLDELLIDLPQDLALLDTTRSLALCREAGVPPLGVVENMAYYVCPHCGDRVEVFDRSDRAWAVRDAGGPLLGAVPLDPALSRAANTGRPVILNTPDSPRVAAFAAIVAAPPDRLAARLTPTTR